LVVVNPQSVQGAVAPGAKVVNPTGAPQTFKIVNPATGMPQTVQVMNTGKKFILCSILSLEYYKYLRHFI